MRKALELSFTVASIIFARLAMTRLMPSLALVSDMIFQLVKKHSSASKPISMKAQASFSNAI
jgi:hypothetical protein